jgi:hypothetical protein
MKNYFRGSSMEKRLGNTGLDTYLGWGRQDMYTDDISSSHSDEYEDGCLLGCCTV